MGPRRPLAECVRDLDSTDELERARGVAAIGHYGLGCPPSVAERVLRIALEDADTLVRGSAARAVVELATHKVSGVTRGLKALAKSGPYPGCARARFLLDWIAVETEPRLDGEPDPEAPGIP